MTEDIVISQLLSDVGNWRDALDRGVKEGLFHERRPLFMFIRDFHREYGELPGKEVIKKNYPNWKPVEDENGLEYHLDQLFQQNSLLTQNEYMEEWLEAKRKGKSPAELAAIINRLNSILMTELAGITDINLKDVEKEKEDYQEKKNRLTVGLPLGYGPLDVENGGALKEQLITIMGPPGNMKTWAAVYSAHTVWVDENVPVLFVSKEMSDEEIRDRVSFFDSKFPFGSFSRGQLTSKLEKEYYANLDKRGRRQDFVITADDGDFDTGGGVSLVAAKIDHYRPAICFIDGAYLLTDDRGGNGWEATRNVFRDLKRLARRKQIPIVVTTQPQRLKEKDGSPLRRRMTTEDVGSAYTISQDSDVLLGIRRIEEDLVEMYTIKNRKGKNNLSWQMRFDLEGGIVRNLEEKEHLSEDEMVFSDDALRFE